MHVLKLTLALFALVILLSGCQAKAPIAKLKYLDFTTGSDGTHHLKFTSDQPILDLFASNKNQRVVYAALKCALGNDQNFDIEHSMKYRVEGTFEKDGTHPTAGQFPHVFDAIVHFWVSGPTEHSRNRYLHKEELAVLLKDKATIPCMVRMTVNFSSPYYSEVMQVPTKDLVAVVRPRPVQ